MAATGSSQAPISFGFSRSSKKKLGSAADLGNREEDKREYLVGAEGKELLSVNPAPAAKALVIPLIQKNRWSQPSKTQEKAQDGDPKHTEEDAVLSQAVQELIQESRRSQENDSEENPTASIPLLMQNRVPDGYEDGDKVDVRLRPESAEAADYEVVPVEQYGMAMLRGMGWKEGEGIGRTFKEDVKPLEQKLRPKGLGLGADRSAIQDLEPQKPRRPLKPGEEPKEEEAKGLGPGSSVEIQSGAHKNLYGKVEGIDPDNARAMVKLAIGGNVVTVSQFALRLVSSSEYKTYAKDLSRLSKAKRQKDLEEAKEEQRRERESEEGEQHRRSRDEHREQSRNGDSGHRHKRPKQRSPEHEKEKKKTRQEPPSWLRRDLKVRFIDKHYKGGKYYNSKVLIEDVPSPRSCVCRTESGRILEDIKQDMLETVIPKEEGDRVMVVLGKHRGQVGTIMHRDKHKCHALVQLQGDHEEGVTLSYDVICHYAGERDD
ncbi:G-patch domain and KOW motifs-containing protein [Spea bombifrons]|uniref:G-patch domain and KOW motifs-containing protein n=1 Tax=Spea bombifrons TaxID=233779 RepID=UPI0023496054|nr:G-patch domain and KOW motifs-containing protein [Spea bombifrons]